MLDELLDWHDRYTLFIVSRPIDYDDSDFTFDNFMSWLKDNYKSTLE